MTSEKKNSESVRETTFKKWSFADEFDIVKKNGELVVEIICKYCPNIDIEQMTTEVVYRKIKGSVLSSLKSYHSPVTYVHKPTLETHVGSANSMHSWCKKKVNSELGLKTTPTIPQHHGQPTTDVSISNSFQDCVVFS